MGTAPNKAPGRNAGKTYNKAHYLYNRRGRWLVQVPVPADLRGQMKGRATGKPLRLVEKYLGTADPKEAKRRAPAAVTAIQDQFDRLRQERLTSDTLKSIYTDELHKRYGDLATDPVDAPEGLGDYLFAIQRGDGESLDIQPGSILRDRAIEFLRRIDAKETEDAIEAVSRELANAAFAAQAHWKRNIPPPRPVATVAGKFTAHLDEWLARYTGTEKTRDMYRSDINRFAKTIPNIADVNRKAVQDWAVSLGLAPKTFDRILASLRGYWKYLQSVQAAPEDVFPFDRLELPKDRNGKRERRKPFDPADVVKLLDAAEDDSSLHDLIRLGMYTGARIEELCALKVDNVHDDYFTVADAKTDAGFRQVPIHQEIQQTFARLTDESKDGYVLSGLTENKYGDRSNAVGKRFGRLKKRLGFGGEYVFHSIRKTVVTQLENAGVHENITADIVGHEKPRITYGLYSGGASLAVKAEALGKVGYPVSTENA